MGKFENVAAEAINTCGVIVSERERRVSMRLLFDVHSIRTDH